MYSDDIVCVILIHQNSFIASSGASEGLNSMPDLSPHTGKVLASLGKYHFKSKELWSSIQKYKKTSFRVYTAVLVHILSHRYRKPRTDTV